MPFICCSPIAHTDKPLNSRWKRKLAIGGSSLLFLVVLTLFCCWWLMIRMPGESFRGDLGPPNELQTGLSDQLRRDVEHLAVTIGERNLERYPQLNKAADFIHDRFTSLGYEVARQEYQVSRLACYNIEAERRGTIEPDEIVIIGAHYDSVIGSPGANDNASGTAALLALAQEFAKKETDRTLRFVAFTNEEPPYFQTADMSSSVYARRCRQRNEKLVAVLSLETIGYFTDEPDSQQYPAPFSAFYPSEGNFIAVVGNVASRRLARRVVDLFRKQASFSSEGAALPGDITGVGWSDHWSFWNEGYAAVMITDTAPFRYPYYHLLSDVPDKLDFDDVSRVVEGLVGVVNDLTAADGSRD